MTGDLVRLLAEGMLDFTVHSTVVLGGLALLFRGWRSAAPALRELLWKAGVLAVVASAAVAAWIPGRTLDPGHREAVLERTLILRPGPEAPVRASERITLSATAARSEACRDLARSAAMPSRDRAADLRDACGSPLQAVPSLLVLLWGGGVLLGTLSVARNALALRRARALARPAEPRTVRLLERLMKRAGVRRPVRVVILPGLASPAALSPGLVGIPPEAQDDLSDAELEAVLAHELAHLRRRDPLWVALLTAVDTLFWFQPLMGWAREEIRGAGEHLADERAVSWTGRPLELARSLARAAEWSLPDRHVPELAVVRPGGTGLSERVERILGGAASAWGAPWWGVPILVALLLAVQGLLPSIHVPPPVDVQVTVTTSPGDLARP